MSDVRKSLPKGLNSVDMDERGDRRVPLNNYGNEFRVDAVYAAMKAWGVLKRWLVNPGPSYQNNGVPNPSREGGPVFMLLFPDGKWRYAKFGGINGPPWTYCPFEGWEAPNGQSAYLTMCLERAIQKRKNLEAEVANVANEVAEMKQQLSAAMKQPERSDEGW